MPTVWRLERSGVGSMGWRQGIADCLDFAVGDMLIVETLHIGMPGSLVNSLMAGERSEHRWVLRTVRESCGIRSRASVVEPERTEWSAAEWK